MLDKVTVDKIAAGEVVENPASVVKELVENSVDAGASLVVVEIEKGGKSLIRVSDNGSGIDREDVPRAFMRHATSKIEKAEDLEKILSLGFRGEALASIAAVSRVTLKTKTGEDLEGTLYRINGGEEVEYREEGCPKGTSVEVRDLFYNTPARREYLKNDAREASQVSDMVSRLALSRTDISFRFTSGGRVLVNTPGNGNLLDTIVSIYGREMGNNLVKVGCTSPGIHVQGFLSRPHITRGNRNHQTFYINGRYVKSDLISQAIQEAYRTLVMVNRYPVAVLFLSLDPKQVDVNVHPTKLQVKFKDEEKVKGAVVDCIRVSLEKGRWIAEPAQRPFFKKKFGEQSQEKFDLSFLAVKEGGTVSPDKGTKVYSDAEKQKTSDTDERLEYNRQQVDNNIKDDKGRLPYMRIIGQFLSTFILAEGEECVYIIDQHAAHERIAYEQLTAWMKRSTPQSQRLVQPEVMEMSPAEAEVLRQNMDSLIKMGFELEDFGVNAFALRAVPVIFGIPQSREFLKELVDGFSQTGMGKDIRLKEEDIIKMSCKKAVKANHRLSLQEMKALVEQLNETEMPFTCPHGRPVMVSLTRYELEKMFNRIQ